MTQENTSDVPEHSKSGDMTSENGTAPASATSYLPRVVSEQVVQEVQTKRWENIVCSRCGEKQENVFDGGFNSGLMIKDGLRVELTGGYAMYFDDMGLTQSIVRLLLCETCINDLRRVWPGLDQGLTQIEEEHNASW